ncbi:MAG: hypothetical protein H6822_11790 [Planctomycetaceae bacterium]|nr:hypothetical protein [Planctomycetales bacterium]MCB9922858.1 hypothetical protein [Planctomycetaceae bacterium]
MTTEDQPNNHQHGPNAPQDGSNKRLIVLVGLLAVALFALWYDYKVARPSVDRAYERIASENATVNAAAEHRLMTNVDVQSVLGRSPNETYLVGSYTVEAYRWRAGMPIELRGLDGQESPGVGLKTHSYYAVYRKDGPLLNFVTHFKYDLDPDYFAEPVVIRSAETGASVAPGLAGAEQSEYGSPESGSGSGREGGGGGRGQGGGGFDPEAMFAERDVDGDGKLTGEEISARMRENLEAIDTDSDGAISKAELLARMSQFRGRGGRGDGANAGPGRGDTSEGSPRRQRPPQESDDSAANADATNDNTTASESEAPVDANASVAPEGNATTDKVPTTEAPEREATKGDSAAIE